ncbi:MAG: hypothetical protein ACMG6S_34315, partial [Byssovorax sp.]
MYDNLDIEIEGVETEEEDRWMDRLEADDIAERMQSDAKLADWIDTHRIRAPWDPPSLSLNEWRERRRRAAQHRTIAARRAAQHIVTARGPQRSRGQTRLRSRRATRVRRAATARGPDPDPCRPPTSSRRAQGRSFAGIGDHR